MEKIFKVSQVRDLLNQVMNEKISFSRFVEILNETANRSKIIITPTYEHNLAVMKTIITHLFAHKENYSNWSTEDIAKTMLSLQKDLLKMEQSTPITAP